MNIGRMGSSRVILLATVVLAFTGAAVGQQFNYATISIPGSTETLVYGINDFGAVAGYYYADNNKVEHGFMRAAGKITNLDYPEAKITACYAINNSGEVVGQYQDTEGVFHAFLYSNGTYTNIDPPGAIDAGAGGINNLGEIAGFYGDAQGAHGFTLSGTTYQTLDVPGAAYTLWAGGINDNGEVTLQWQPTLSMTTQSSVYNGSSYAEIPVAGSEDVYAWGINNKGNIALVWLDENTQLYQAALSVPRGSGYVYSFIEDPAQSETDSTQAYGVDNNNVVVGLYIGSTGYLGFAARPTRSLTPRR